MQWDLNKLHNYMAFYLTEDKDFKEAQLTDEQRAQKLLNKFNGG